MSILYVPAVTTKTRVYFTGGEEAKIRCSINAGVKQDIVKLLQEMLHAEHSYVKGFKAAMEVVSADSNNYKIVIDADKRPTGEHARRFNLPESNEVGILMKGQEHGKRDIVLQARDDSLKYISETHRAYDSLQYPLLFSRGEDGYHFGLKQSLTSSKKLTCMQLYSFMFMERKNSFNTLMRSRDLKFMF